MKSENESSSFPGLDKSFMMRLSKLSGIFTVLVTQAVLLMDSSVGFDGKQFFVGESPGSVVLGGGRRTDTTQLQGVAHDSSVMETDLLSRLEVSEIFALDVGLNAVHAVKHRADWHILQGNQFHFLSPQAPICLV